MKEQVTKFNLEAAFKALNEIEIPNVGGIKPNKDNQKELRESFRPTPHTDCLIEDYYNINNQEDLTNAKEDRAEEVAQAKLAKIEKIVDLDAETPEDIQPSYVGKTIVQCPQCMTLFYRKPEDLHVSEEDETLVNVGEACPNCSNDSGYTVIGKVAEENLANEGQEEDEASKLDLNVEEPTEEESVEETSEEEIPEASENEEVAAEETEELTPVEEPAEENAEEVTEESEDEKEEEEKKEESFAPHSENILAEQVENALTEDPKNCPECGKEICECNKSEEKLEEDLQKELDFYNDYIVYLQRILEQDEEALERAKKMDKNEDVIKAIERRIANDKAELDDALPKLVKEKQAEEDLPTPEETDEEVSKNESLKEAEDVIAKNAPEEGEKVELKQKAVSEIHKGKEEHVPGAIVDQEVNESLSETKIMSKQEFEARAKELGIKRPKHEALEEEAKEIVLDDSDAAVEKMLDSKEFQTPVSKAEVEEIFAEAKENEKADDLEAAIAKRFKKIDLTKSDELDSIEEIDDKTVEECITESLVNVYENVESFKLTNCELLEDKFIVEGDINFKSGNKKATKYVFTEALVQENNMIVFSGINEDFDKNGNFILTCLAEANRTCLLAESLEYKYNIGENLVEGLAFNSWSK